jgi:hypothetical protein
MNNVVCLAACTTSDQQLRWSRFEPVGRSSSSARFDAFARLGRIPLTCLIIHTSRYGMVYNQNETGLISVELVDRILNNAIIHLHRSSFPTTRQLKLLPRSSSFTMVAALKFMLIATLSALATQAAPLVENRDVSVDLPLADTVGGLLGTVDGLVDGVNINLRKKDVDVDLPLAGTVGGLLGTVDGLVDGINVDLRKRQTVNVNLPLAQTLGEVIDTLNGLLKGININLRKKDVNVNLPLAQILGDVVDTLNGLLKGINVDLRKKDVNVNLPLAQTLGSVIDTLNGLLAGINVNL